MKLIETISLTLNGGKGRGLEGEIGGERERGIIRVTLRLPLFELSPELNVRAHPEKLNYILSAT